MTPEKLAEIQMLRSKIADPATPEADRMALVRKAVQMVRDERGIIATRVEEKAAKKKKTAITGADLLDSFIGTPSGE